jgi:hypothetical protein
MFSACTFKDRLVKVIEEISTNEVMRALENIVRRRPENLIEGFLNEINFNRKLGLHPLVGKILRKGHLANIIINIRRSEEYKRLNDKLAEILERQIEIEDITEIKNLLGKLMDKAMDYIVKMAGDSGQGLRHIHAPGSVAKNEGRNLHFGEKYTQETLYWLASRVCDSIALGDSLGIYSENEKLMLYLRQLAQISFGSTFKIDLRNLEIYEDEANHPYAVLLKFILWLVKRLEVEDKPEIRTLIHSILNEIRTSTISLFFLPPEEEKWSTIGLPRLDIFIGRWILDRKSRVKIETLRDELNNFIAAARKEARKEGKIREVENTVNLLMNNYEAFCRRLIEHGDLDFYAIRKLMDIVVDLGTRYGLKIYLRPLGSVIGY